MVSRRLTTILSADVAGYSRMMGEDEPATLAQLKDYRGAIEGFIARHRGRVVNWAGDGLLAEFQSVVEAVQCAAEIQRELGGRNAARTDGRRMDFRIGINLGDVMADGDDLFGEGVNIAARLQAMAPEGGILISGSVYEQVRNKLSFGYSFLGAQQVKNIADDVSVYAIDIAGSGPLQAGRARNARAADRPVAVAPSATGPGAPARPASLMRRGLAFLADYVLAVAIALPGAIALERNFDDVIELDVPLLDLGTATTVSREPARVETPIPGLTVTVQVSTERVDVFGLAQHTYRVTDTEIEVAPGEADAEVSERAIGRAVAQTLGAIGDSGRQMIDPQTGRPINPPSLALVVGLLLFLMVSLLEASPLQGSIGKRMLGLRVTREDGGRVGLFKALGRNALKVLSAVLLLIGFLMALWTKRKQTLHDRMVSAVVIRTE